MPLFWTTIFVRASFDGGEPREAYLHLLVRAADLAAAETMATGNEAILAGLLGPNRTRVKIVASQVLRTVEVPSGDEPAFLVGFADPAGVLASDALGIALPEHPDHL